MLWMLLFMGLDSSQFHSTRAITSQVIASRASSRKYEGQAPFLTLILIRCVPALMVDGDDGEYARDREERLKCDEVDATQSDTCFAHMAVCI